MIDTYLLWAIALFVTGLVVAVIEVIVPSAGVLALVSLACLVGSLAAAYQLSGWTAATLAVIEGVVVPLAILGAFKLLPRTSVGKQMILEPPGASKSSGTSVPGVTNAAQLVNRTGLALTQLRPSGTAEIDGQRMSVVTNGEMIEKDAKVRVVQVEGSRVVVEQVRA